jgi:hypothetical protein
MWTVFSVKAIGNQHDICRAIGFVWERGEKHPQGASLKLLSIVAK